MTSKENGYVGYVEYLKHQNSHELMVVSYYEEMHGFASCPAEGLYAVVSKERLKQLQSTMSSHNSSKVDLSEKNISSVSQLVLLVNRGYNFVNRDIFRQVVEDSGLKTEQFKNKF